MLAAVATLVPIIGCGDDRGTAADGTSTAPGDVAEQSAKTLFIRSANEACRKDARKIRAKAQGITAQASGDSQEALAGVVIRRAIAPGLEAQVAAVRALEPPPGEAEKVNEVLTAIQATVADARRDPAAFVRQGDSFTDSSSAAAQYGLTACGHP